MNQHKTNHLLNPIKVHNNTQRVSCSFKRILVCLFTIYLTGCAAPYHRADKEGILDLHHIGYDDVKMDDEIFYVEYSGNGFSSYEYVEEQFHRRASELCPNGYDTKVTRSTRYESNFDSMTCIYDYCRNWKTAQGIVSCKKSK